jgi:signal transduction histidine kinase
MKVSLRRRLLLILMLLMLFAWVSSAALTVLASSRVFLAQLDRQLTQYSDLAWYMTQVFASQGEEHLRAAYPWWTAIEGVYTVPMVIPGPGEGGLAPALNVWHGGRLIAALENSPHFPAPQQEGFYFLRDPSGEGGWRILARQDESSGLWLLVGADLESSRWEIFEVFARAVFPLLIVLPLTVLILYFGVSRGLRPLQLLAGQISRRNPQLLEPIDQQGVPAEIEPVVDSLNQLLSRLGSALESEQRFTANAAHELMTPLAAIKTEVQLCQRQAEDGASRAMLDRIVSRVDRATHTVQQLLTLARLDPEAPRELSAVELRRVVEEAIAETVHVALENDLTVDLPAGPPLKIMGDAESLGILCRNLLTNAFHYASPGTEVGISLQTVDQGVRLRVVNDSEPVSQEQFNHVRDRFYRIPGSAGLGAGLGLSIVQGVVRLHGARIKLGPWRGKRGFAVEITFVA